MKWIISVSVFCVFSFLSFHIFGDDISKLISLKMGNEKVEGVIINLQKSGSSKSRYLKIEYNYEYKGKSYSDKIKILF